MQNLAQLTRSRFAEQLVLSVLRARGEALAHTAWTEKPVERLLNQLCALGYDFLIQSHTARVIAEPINPACRVEF